MHILAQVGIFADTVIAHAVVLVNRIICEAYALSGLIIVQVYSDRCRKLNVENNLWILSKLDCIK